MDFFDFFPRDHFAEDRFSLLPTGYWTQLPSESELRYLQLIGLMPDAQAEASYIEDQSGSMISTQDDRYIAWSPEPNVSTEIVSSGHELAAVAPFLYSDLANGPMTSYGPYTTTQLAKGPMRSSYPSNRSVGGMDHRSLRFSCGNQEGIRLDLALRGDMQGLSDPDYRGFFEGFGDKASFKLYMADGRRFTKQKNCKHMLGGRPVYITRVKIAVEIAKFVRDFIHNDPYSGQRAIFVDRPIGRVALENFVLVELKRVSKASVQPIFRYRPPGPA